MLKFLLWWLVHVRHLTTDLSLDSIVKHQSVSFHFLCTWGRSTEQEWILGIQLNEFYGEF